MANRWGHKKGEQQTMAQSGGFALLTFLGLLSVSLSSFIDFPNGGSDEIEVLGETEAHIQIVDGDFSDKIVISIQCITENGTSLTCTDINGHNCSALEFNESVTMQKVHLIATVNDSMPTIKDYKAFLVPEVISQPKPSNWIPKNATVIIKDSRSNHCLTLCLVLIFIFLVPPGLRVGFTKSDVVKFDDDGPTLFVVNFDTHFHLEDILHLRVTLRQSNNQSK